MHPYLVLLRVGFAVPCGVGPAGGGLLLHRFTLTTRPCGPFGGLFSVALSVGSRRPGVTWHSALWSPDFPRRDCSRRDCLADSVRAQCTRRSGMAAVARIERQRAGGAHRPSPRRAAGPPRKLFGGISGGPSEGDVPVARTDRASCATPSGLAPQQRAGAPYSPRAAAKALARLGCGELDAWRVRDIAAGAAPSLHIAEAVVERRDRGAAGQRQASHGWRARGSGQDSPESAESGLPNPRGRRDGPIFCRCGDVSPPRHPRTAPSAARR